MQLQYIGARYVPVWYHNSVDDTANWEVNVEYEPLTWVTTQNNHLYLSKKAVPDNIGTPAENTEYWLDMGVFSGSYTDLVEQIEEINTIIANMQTVEGSLQNQIEALGDAVEDTSKRVIRPRRIVAVSDSYGMGRGDTTPWCTLLKDYMGITNNADFYNISEGAMGFNRAGSDGHTVQQLLESKIDDISNPETIEAVVFGLGLNDTLATTGLYFAIMNCLTYAKSVFPNANIYVGFIGNFYSKTSAELNAYTDTVSTYITVAERMNAAYITGIENVMHDCRLFLADGVHPTEGGQQEIAKYVCGFLNGGAAFVRHVESSIAGSVVGAGSKLSMTIDNDTIGLYLYVPSNAAMTMVQSTPFDLGEINEKLLVGIGGVVHYGFCFLGTGSSFSAALWYILGGHIYILPMTSFTVPSTARCYFGTMSYPTIEG